VVDVLRAMPAGGGDHRDHRERGTPVAPLAEQVVVLDEVDERSVVQTRFATTTLALLRAQLGHDLGPVAEQGRACTARPAAAAGPRGRAAHLPRPG